MLVDLLRVLHFFNGFLRWSFCWFWHDFEWLLFDVVNVSIVFYYCFCFWMIFVDCERLCFYVLFSAILLMLDWVSLVFNVFSIVLFYWLWLGFECTFLDFDLSIAFYGIAMVRCWFVLILIIVFNVLFFLILIDFGWFLMDFEWAFVEFDCFFFYISFLDLSRCWLILGWWCWFFQWFPIVCLLMLVWSRMDVYWCWLFFFLRFVFKFYSILIDVGWILLVFLLFFQSSFVDFGGVLNGCSLILFMILFCFTDSWCFVYWFLLILIVFLSRFVFRF